MNEEQKRELAKHYVDKQLQTIRAHGSIAELSEAEYRALIDDVASLICDIADQFTGAR